MMLGDYLIIGLGNPGVKYAKTRHNLGFMVVKAFGQSRSWSFKRSWRLKGQLAHGNVGEKKVHLLLPGTYMNLSGKAVRKAVDYYKIAIDDLVVVVDDIYLKLGMLRFRVKGSSGGHKGLKSIDESLTTQGYSRLRMGVGPQKGENRENFVLANFDKEEEAIISNFIKEGIVVLENWLNK